MKKINPKINKPKPTIVSHRDGLEIWIDKHNHKLELLRTVTSLIGIGLSTIIILKVFTII